MKVQLLLNLLDDANLAPLASFTKTLNVRTSQMAICSLDKLKQCSSVPSILNNFSVNVTVNRSLVQAIRFYLLMNYIDKERASFRTVFLTVLL